MKICLTCADGGHLTEMLELVDAFSAHEVFFITYSGFRSKGLREQYTVYEVPNFVGHKVPFVLSFPKMLSILVTEKPDMVVSTGSELAIPVFYFARALGIKTVFIETMARITQPSFTGKMVYPISSLFLVQWKELLKVYGSSAQFWGSIF